MEETPLKVVEEISWGKVLTRGGIMYGTLSVALAVIMIISTSITCSKQNLSNSFILGFELALLPAVALILSLKYAFIREPFSNTLESFGLAPERSSIIASAYILILFLLPLTVYGIHSAENSACVASAGEMSSFKQKMLKELQEKQELEEKNTLKK
jgi:F0F1-type ATP synthase assembly protein I